MRITQSLIDQLNSDVNATEITQERIEETLSQLTQTVNEFTQQLEQVTLTLTYTLQSTLAYTLKLLHSQILITNLSMHLSFTKSLQAMIDVAIVNHTSNQVQSVVRNTSSIVDSTTQYATQLLNISQQLKYQARDNEQRILTNSYVRHW